MTVRSRANLYILWSAGTLLAVVCAWWIGRKGGVPTTASPASPSTAHKISEEDLGIVPLSAEAARHLGVVTAPIERKAVRRVTTLH